MWRFGGRACRFKMPGARDDAIRELASEVKPRSHVLMQASKKMAKAKDYTRRAEKAKFSGHGWEDQNKRRGRVADILNAAAIGLLLALFAWLIGRTPIFHGSDGRCFFPLRLLFWLFFEISFGPVCTQAILIPTRWIARYVPGAAGSIPPAEDRQAVSEQEQQHHDPSLEWPPESAKLPTEWRQIVASQRPRPSQPYFLNHVRGHVRFCQAAVRIGAACGTLLQTFALAALLDGTSWLDAILLRNATWTDLILGAITGMCCILVIFAAEVSFGWVQVIGYFEVVAPNEWLSLNLFFDVLFHLGVAINEELSLRGWLFAASAQFFMSGTGVDAGWATILAVGAQSLVFAAAHAASPGASAVGLVNLTIGGVAAALNVVLTGGLTFALGWHFSWNLFMGHLLGLSTSGIPMSAKLVSVVPHPAKAKLHGGRFGPEQSPLAPLAYLFGLLMLVVFYGVTQGPVEWERRLSGAIGALPDAVPVAVPTVESGSGAA